MSDSDKRYLGYSKFHNSAKPLKGKELEAQRVLCACLLIREMVWHLIPDHKVRNALEIAERYAEGRGDKIQLFKARKMLKSLKFEGEFHETEARRQAHMVVLHVTLRPFGLTALRSIAQLIVDGLGHKYLAVHTDISDATQVEDEAYKQMAGLVLKFLGRVDIDPDQTPDLRDDARFAKYYYKYINPYEMRDSILMGKRDAESKKICLSAIDAFFRIAPLKDIGSPDLDPIKSAIEQPDSYSGGIELLSILGVHHPAPLQLLYDLLSNSRSDIRLKTIQLVGYYKLDYPTKWVTKMIDRALQDKSSQVRLFGVEACSKFQNIPNLIQSLNALRIVETNSKVRENLDFWIPLLKDGYFFEKDDGIITGITVLMKHGGVTSVDIDEADLSPHKLKRIIEGIRNETC